MSVVEALLNSSELDTKLLISNDEKGDDFSALRDVDFIFKTDDQSKAETVCGFINDNNYASANFESIGNEFRVIATIHMQSTQNLICTTSGLMTCVAKLFNVEYDGWGCTLQNT